MRGWYRSVHACGDRLPKGLVWGHVQLTVHNVLFCVQVWSLTKFYRLNGSQIANLTLDSKLTPVLCHHWQVGDVGCRHGVWTPVMKIHGDQVWKKKFFFYLFLAEFLLKSEVLWKSLLDSLAAKKRIAWCGRSGTNSRDSLEGDGGIRNNNNNSNDNNNNNNNNK